MNETIKRWMRNGLKLVPLPVFEMLFPMDLTGFFFHAVTETDLPHVKHLYAPVDAGDFEATLVDLKKHYTFVSYGDLVDARNGKKDLPKNAAHLSFDDGFVENYSVVMPILQRLGIPCMFFLTSEWIDNRALFYRSKVSLCVETIKKSDAGELQAILARVNQPHLVDETTLIKKLMHFRQEDEAEVDEFCKLIGVDVDEFLAERKPFLTTAQIEEMHAAGFVFGGHSVSHRKFVQLPVERVEAEIVDSCEKIQAITGQEEVPFAFPNSATGFDRALLGKIREKHDLVGLIFNSKGFLPDEDYLYNRIWLERNLKNGKGKTSWRDYVKDAYEGFVWDWILHLRR